MITNKPSSGQIQAHLSGLLCLSLLTAFTEHSLFLKIFSPPLPCCHTILAFLLFYPLSPLLDHPLFQHLNIREPWGSVLRGFILIFLNLVSPSVISSSSLNRIAVFQLTSKILTLSPSSSLIYLVFLPRYPIGIYLTCSKSIS